MRVLATMAVAAPLLTLTIAKAGGHVLGQPSQAALTSNVAANPAALVNPLWGTGRANAAVGSNDMFPAADMPFGMIQWGPDTTSRPPGGGYSWYDSAITGFSLTHLSGSGCAVEGDIPILPMTGTPPADPGTVTEKFSHSTESAHPGSYAVTAGGVRTQLAVTDRSGVAAFTYPATTSAQLLVKVANSANGSSAASFQADGNQEISGSVTTGHFCGRPDVYTLYFAAKFSQPFTSSGTWGGATQALVRRHAAGTSLSVHGTQHPAPLRYSYNAANDQGTGVAGGGWLTFDTTGNPVIGMQVAISYVSVAGAQANLAAEATTWNVGTVAAQAATAWNGQLTHIAVSGGSQLAEKKFYTALYHASLAPTLFSDDDGQYAGFDNQVHQVQAGHAQYADYSGWDIYRSQAPLLAMIDARIASDMATSLLNDAAQGGWLPKWPVANGYTSIMNGDSADPILANLYAFGARAFDTGTALADMVDGANGGGSPGQGWYVERPLGGTYISRGYVPNVAPPPGQPSVNGASETLEYALDDFAISRFAHDLGQAGTASTFLNRSQNWTKVFDTAVRYPEPRDNAGAFASGAPVQANAGFGQIGFQEGNAAQYTWMVPQNLPAVARAIGGNGATAARLNTFFSRLNAGPNAGNEWAGNEPNFGSPWVYDSIGQPWRTQAVVRSITSSLFAAVPAAEPGNDDLGALSSWYVWATLGVYPQAPGAAMLVLGTPQFSHEVIAGKLGTLTINAANAGDTYVQSLRVDGRAANSTWITPLGHTLNFTLSNSPNARWGSAANSAPPSFGAGPVQFPPSTRAFLAASPASVTLAPGGSTTLTVQASNKLGPSQATVNWQAVLPAGLSAQPAKGALTAAAGGIASAKTKITAGSGVAAGTYTVTFTGKAANGAVIPQVTIAFTVT